MQTEHITVTGMTCGGCISNVTKALKTIAGVARVDVALAEGAATVQYDEGRVSPAQLKSAVQSAGYGVAAAQKPARAESKGCCCG